MNKKALFSTLGVMLAAVIASVALVFTVGPMVSADDNEPGQTYTLNAEHFIVENGQIIGLTEAGYEIINNMNWKDIVKIIIPESVEYLSYYSSEYSSNFFNSLGINNLESITFPSSLKILAEYSCGWNDSLKELNINEGLLVIGAGCFSGCRNLNDVTLPSTLTVLEEGAFSYCESLTSIVIPANVTITGNYVFDCCDNLTQIYCEAPTKPDGWLSNWKGDCDAKVVWGYNAGNSQSGNENQNQENQPNNQNENTNAETPADNTTVTSQASNNQANTAVVAAVAGTAGGAAGLGTMGTIFGIVVSRKRKKL